MLPLEAFVLEKLVNKPHFCRLEAQGTMGTYNYLVMSLVRHNLFRLKHNTPDAKFSWSTAVRVGLQCLVAIRDLHDIGYLHRDVKPSNLCIGRHSTNERRTVFLLDFGMCRKFVNADGRVLAVYGGGTTRYNSISRHWNEMLGWKDDLEMWFYSLVELTTSTLPWSGMSDPADVRNLKLKCKTDSKRLLNGCPEGYGTILDHIHGLKYWHTPDYELLGAILNKILVDNKYTFDSLYDWEMPAFKAAWNEKYAKRNKPK